jgi:hypothetical protein
MSLQGFGGRNLQGIYGVLQGFGDRVLRGSSPEHLFIYDDNVYVIDTETQSVKIYSTTGTKVDEFFVDSRPDQAVPSIISTMKGFNKIYADSTRIIVGLLNYSIVLNNTGVEISNSYGTGSGIFYDEEFYIPTSGNPNTVIVKDINGVTDRTFSMGGRFNNRGFDVKDGFVYFVGERSRSFGLATVLMKIFDTSGSLIDEFEYWEKPGFPPPSDEIGLHQPYFVAHGNYVHSGMYTNQDVYRNSTATGIDVNKFSINEQRRWVAWYNNELYYTTPSASIIVCNDTTGDVVREWSTID